MKRGKNSFFWIVVCWLLATALMVIYVAKDALSWLWWPIGILIFIGIVIYHSTGGPKAFRYYNKKLNKEDKDEEKKD